MNNEIVHGIVGRNFQHMKEFDRILARANDDYAIGSLTLAEYDDVARKLKEAIIETRAMLVELDKTL